LAILGVQLYLSQFSPAPVPVAQAKSEVVPPASDSKSGEGEAGPRKSGLIEQVAGRDLQPDPMTVTAAKVGTGTPVEKLPRQIVDPWPELEIALGGNGEEANKAFENYTASDPPRNPERRAVALCVIGDLNPAEERLLQVGREFLAITFDTPVRIQRRLRIGDLPPQAVRTEERLNDSQLDAGILLGEVLPSERGPESFALVGVTSADLFPLPTAELLRWQGVETSRVSLVVLPRQSAGTVSPDAARHAIRQTLSAALRGVAPLLGLNACSSGSCGLHSAGPAKILCAECLHQLSWNLDVSPTALLQGQQRFFEKHGLREEAAICREQLRRLKTQSRKMD